MPLGKRNEFGDARYAGVDIKYAHNISEQMQVRFVFQYRNCCCCCCCCCYCCCGLFWQLLPLSQLRATLLLSDCAHVYILDRRNTCSVVLTLWWPH